MPEVSPLHRLRTLKLYGMAAAWQEYLAEAPRTTLTPEGLLLRLLDAEQVDRQARSLAYQLKAARFPVHRDLTGFHWQESPLEQARIEQLAQGDYMDTAHNLILVGGTGKSQGRTRKIMRSGPQGMCRLVGTRIQDRYLPIFADICRFSRH